MKDGDQYPILNRGQARDFVRLNKWVFAASMPKCPHEYLLAWRSTDKEVFMRFVMTIRRMGYDQKYYNKPMRYLDLDGWKYWTMGEFTETTFVLNRALLEKSHEESWIFNPVPFEPYQGRELKRFQRPVQ